MFINERFKRKILVYDLYGNFKRSINHKDSVMYKRIFNYDKNNLICDDGSYYAEGERNEQSFFIISKKDGSIVNEIKISFKQEKSTFLTVTDENRMEVMGYINHSITPYKGKWILSVPSSDTVYRYISGQNITPFIVRKPSIQSMDPEVFLNMGIFTDNYYFLGIAKKEYDFKKHEGFPKKYFMYDRQKNKIYDYSVLNDDYTDKKNVILDFSHVSNDEIAFCSRIEVHALIEAYGKEELKGKLKEIAAGLDEDSNPVIMLVKHKL